MTTSLEFDVVEKNWLHHRYQHEKFYKNLLISKNRPAFLTIQAVVIYIIIGFPIVSTEGTVSNTGMALFPNLGAAGPDAPVDTTPPANDIEDPDVD